jgi:hypothetical protein
MAVGAHSLAALDRARALHVPGGTATWSPGGQLDWWVKDRQEWWGRVRGADGRQRWIRAIDLCPTRDTAAPRRESGH